MDRGRIVKALSGFYYVEDGDKLAGYMVCQSSWKSWPRGGMVPPLSSGVPQMAQTPM